MHPKLIQGGCHSDARGALRFCNGFDMSAVRRFYTISNSAGQPVRGWIGHRRETKWFFPLKERTEILVEPMSEFNAESPGSLEAVKFELDATVPSVLKVPPGNWFCIRQDGNAEVMVFSDCRLGEFENDDFRR